MRGCAGLIAHEQHVVRTHFVHVFDHRLACASVPQPDRTRIAPEQPLLNKRA